MKLIVLMGLVTVEKHEIAQAIAHHYSAIARSVALLDNVARLPLLANSVAPHSTCQRVEGDVLDQLPAVVTKNESDVVVLALSEQVAPEMSLVALDTLYDLIPELELLIIALIDTRTCDCFPNLREAFVDHADVVLNLPLSNEDWLEAML